MFDIIAAVLATWRLTQVVTEDKVFDPVRKIFKNWPQVLLFLGCSKCVSVWCGGLALITYLYAPYLNWIFAFSASYSLYLLITNWIGEYVRYKVEKVLPHIVLRPAGSNGIKMDFYNVTENEAKNVVVSLASELTNQRVK